MKFELIRINKEYGVDRNYLYICDDYELIYDSVNRIITLFIDDNFKIECDLLDLNKHYNILSNKFIDDLLKLNEVNEIKFHKACK